MNNGDILKGKLGIEIDGSILDKALHHISCLNNTSEVYEVVKIESSIGKYLIEMCYHINQLLNTSKSMNEIINEFDIEEINRQINNYFSMDELIYLSEGERNIKAKDKLYQDVISRVMFTIYTVKGIETVNRIISKILVNYKGKIDYKTKLQEYVQAKKQTVSYELVNQSGPAHDRYFEVKVTALEKEVQASGKSKKIAEQQAARKYFEVYKIQYEDKRKSKNKGKMNLLSDKSIDLKRESEIDLIIKTFEIDENNISKSSLNCAFIHKSFANTCKENIIDNSYLVPLGSSILSFYLSIYMYKNNGKYKENSREFISDLSVLVKNDMISSLIRNDFNKINKFIKVVKGFPDIQFTITDVFKSIFASIIINGYIYKEIRFMKSEKEILKIIHKYFQYKIFDEHISYSNWLNSFSEKLGIEYNIADLTESGKDNEKIFTGKLIVCLSKYGIDNFSIEKESRTKKELFSNLSENFYKYLVSTCNITKFLEKDDDRKTLLLRDLVNVSLRIDGFYYSNINILGGLCLREWNKSDCIKIVIAFRNAKLNSELIYLYNRWQMLYKDKSDEIKEIFDIEDVLYLMEEVKMDLVKEFDPFAEYLL